MRIMNELNEQLPAALADGLEGSHPVLGFSPFNSMDGWRAKARIVCLPFFYPLAEANGN